MNARAIEIAALIVQRFEGFRAKPYLCPAGIPTIGWGFTHYSNGWRVTLTDPPLTLYQADTLLQEILHAASIRLDQVISSEHSAGVAGALLDFTYNLGEGALKSSTLLKRIQERNYNAAETELRRWVYARGRIFRGLVLRREAEIEYMRNE